VVFVCDARHYDLTIQRISTSDGLPTNVVNRVWQDSIGYMWIETSNGLSRYDGYRVTQVDDSIRRVSSRSEVLKTRDAEWFRTGNGKLERRGRNGSRQSWQMISPEVIAYTHNDHFHVADVDGQTEAVSTYGNGLYLYDKPTGELTHVGGELTDYPYLTHLFVDRTGGIWLAADYLGVVCVRKNMLNYRRQLLVANSPFYDSNHVRSIGAIDESRLLIGNQMGELYEYDTRSHLVKYAGRTQNRVYSVLKDSQGRLWKGTRGGGLWVDDKHVEGLPSPHIYRIHEDANGDIWVAMLQGGVARIGADGIKTLLKGKDCHDIVQDKEGRWWIAAEDSIYVFEKKGQKSVAFGVQEGFFVCLFMDADGDVWAGSIGRGLLKCRFSGGKMTANKYTASNGLPNNNVYCITGDKRGDIWIGTENGLLSFNPKTGDMRSYWFSSSLLANVFDERAAACMSDGLLILGTHDGIIAIEPEMNVASSIPPRTSITALMANGEDATLEKKDFSYREHNFTLCFSNFQYSTLSSVLYQYYLEGFDSEWCSPTKEHAAVYRNLPPGRYVFHVRSMGGMGQWGEETTYEFTIHQPWWNAWWAWSIYVLTFAVVLAAILRMMRLSRQIDVERRVSAFQKDFYDRIEHELRNPVNVLLGASENVQVGGTSKTTVQSLRRGSKRMLGLMDMIRQFHKLNDLEMQLKAETDAMNKETEQRFRQIVAGIHAEEPEYREMAPPPINNLTVLIVEDDEDSLRHLTDTLNSYFRIIGNSRLSECEESVAVHQPSLVIMDISGRETNGCDVTRRLHAAAPSLPVIHLSSCSDDAHQLRSLRSGAKDYIVKPFSGKVLLERVRKALEQPLATAQEVGATQKEILTDVKDRKFLDRMNATLAAHIGEENFSVEQWATLMNLGRTQFYKNVKELTGLTPVQHLHSARLEYAARLLRETSSTIEEVMLRAGYRNPTHFYHSFKKKFGMSPKAYRRN
jgi:ligand-binding sensor domain-containing protein/AraC-like DNA-binding protein